MWLMRILGIWSLLVAMVALTIDATKSLAGQEKWIVTPLGEYWFKLSSASLNASQAAIQRHVHPYLWDPIILNILQTPAWVFFTILGLLFYWIGRRRTHKNVYSN